MPLVITVDTSSDAEDLCAIIKSLPPVSPTILGYVLYFSIFVPISFHKLRNTPVEPVKCNVENLDV